MNATASWKWMAMTVLVLFIIGSIVTAVPSEVPIDSIVRDSSARIKIHPDIQKELQKNIIFRPKETLRVLVKSDENLERISELLKENSGNIRGKYDLGGVVVVDVPLDKIASIAGAPEVSGIWPNRV
ncbi:unnamed protein product, partial [marine sediment metagenome]